MAEENVANVTRVVCVLRLDKLRLSSKTVEAEIFHDVMDRYGFHASLSNLKEQTRNLVLHLHKVMQ